MNSQPKALNTLKPELSFDGVSGYSVQGQAVTLTIGQINNNRAEGNVSGSLVVELVGRAHDALHIPMVFATADLAPLFGGFCVQGVVQTVPFFEPQAGQWNLSLELREWCGSGYATIDRIEFAAPYLAACEVPSRPLVINSWVDNVVSVDFSAHNEPELLNDNTPVPALAGEAEIDSEEAALATTEAPPLVKQAVAKAPTKAPAKTGAKTVTKNQPVNAKVCKPEPQAPDAGVQKAARNKRVETEKLVVSVNHGSVKELTQVKGISERIAQMIIKGRPYKQVTDLLMLKGIGPKLLAKWKAFLTL